MNNLQTRERANGNAGGPGLLGRPFADLWGFDPFRNFVSPTSGLGNVEVTRTESGYQVEFPVAGFRPDEIEVTLEDGLLSVKGKSERRGAFTRSLTVPEEVDAEKIEAHVEHGMLTLTLTLQPKAQPKRIAIKAK